MGRSESMDMRGIFLAEVLLISRMKPGSWQSRSRGNVQWGRETDIEQSQ